MKITIADLTQEPFTFESYFQAESYLEKHGYHCEKERWIACEKPDVSVVPNGYGVEIQPITH